MFPNEDHFGLSLIDYTVYLLALAANFGFEHIASFINWRRITLLLSDNTIRMQMLIKLQS